MPTIETKKANHQKLVNGILAAVLFLYISVSMLVMNHLVQENNSFCQSRQVARSTIRTLFEQKSPTWTLADQKFLDEGLAEIVSC